MAIRIFHVILTLRRGGAERQLVDVVINTGREEFEHVVCFFHPPDDFAPGLRAAGHTVISLNLTARRPWFSAARKLSALLSEYRPDVAHSWSYDADISLRLTQCGLRQIPLVTSLQIPTYEPDAIRAANLSLLKVTGLRWIDLISARWARPTFVACSNFVKHSTSTHLRLRPEDIHVIYNSIDPGTLRSEPGAARSLRHSLGIAEEAFVYLTVGRLDPQKGHADLLRAFHKISPAQPKSFLAIVGEGPLASSLRALADELRISGRVLFLGRREDIGTCLEMADVFVFPSFFEGFGIALAEAMFKHLPCIATSCTALPEVISNEQTGLLVAPGSVDELAAAMARLHGDPTLRAAVGARAEQDARRRFLSSVLMPSWEALYRQVAQHGQDRASRDGLR